jgi:hypothetical protein
MALAFPPEGTRGIDAVRALDICSSFKLMNVSIFYEEVAARTHAA